MGDGDIAHFFRRTFLKTANRFHKNWGIVPPP
jgi:hypothetical protein